MELKVGRRPGDDEEVTTHAALTVTVGLMGGDAKRVEIGRGTPAVDFAEKHFGSMEARVIRQGRGGTLVMSPAEAGELQDNDTVMGVPAAISGGAAA